MGMTYSEVRSLPLAYRRWFLKRLIKHFESKKKKDDVKQQAPPGSIQSVHEKDEKHKSESKKIDMILKKFSS